MALRTAGAATGAGRGRLPQLPMPRWQPPSRRDQARSRPPSVPIPPLQPAGGGIRRITGAPLVWKELRFFTPHSRKLTILVSAAALATLVLTYATLEAGDVLEEDFAQVFYVLLYFVAGCVVTGMLAATGITAEKDSRALPILLTAPVSDWRIIMAKAGGAFRRALAAWLLLTVHLVLFTAMGYFHPIGVLHVVMVASYMAVFLTGLGLYFSSRCRTSSGAVTLTAGTAVVLWLILPAVVPAVVNLRLLPTLARAGNPFLQALVATKAAGGRENALEATDNLLYKWPFDPNAITVSGQMMAYDGVFGQSPTTRARQTTLILLYSLLGYTAAGLLLICRAKARLRKNLF